jgi:hypothetical protein
MQSSSVSLKKRAASRDRTFWQEIVKEFTSSNEKAKDFCESRDIKLGTLSHWRGVFKKENTIQANKFIEVKVTQSDKTPINFTIECPGGHKIIFGAIALEEAKNMLKLLGIIAC